MQSIRRMAREAVQNRRESVGRSNGEGLPGTDTITGNRVKRISELPVRSRPNGIRDYVLSVLCGSRRNSWDREQSKEQAHPFPFAEYQAAMLDVEYWREMELLSGQREHFKPGRNEENCYADDEVAA